jgi:hypothetical protein
MSTYVVRHAPVIAGAVSTTMLVAAVAAIPAIFALHEPLSDLVFWPTIVSFVLSGWLLTVRLPRNAVGWLLLMTALGLSFLPWSLLSSWLLAHDVGIGRWTGGLSSGAWVLLIGGLALLLPLLFPDGRLPSSRRWWRLVLWCDVGYMVIAGFNLFQPGPLELPGAARHVRNPFGAVGAGGWLQPFIACCIPMLLTGFVGSFTALVTRWRSAGPAQRAQMKWVIIALVLAPVPFILHDWVLPVSNAMMTFVLPLVPIAVAVSVLRYRLYDIDRIFSRAVSYLLVTGLLVGVYVACIAMTDAMLPVGSSIGVAAATLAAAAMFQPLRRRVQAAVDHRFNRARYDAARTIDAFAVRLRDEVDPDAVRRDLLAVTSRAVEPDRISLWVAS